MKADVKKALRLQVAKTIKEGKYASKMKAILVKPTKKRAPAEVHALTQQL